MSSKWIKDLTVTELCSHDPLARGRLLKRAMKTGEGHCRMTDEDATGLADAIAAKLVAPGEMCALCTVRFETTVSVIADFVGVIMCRPEAPTCSGCRR